MKKNWKIEAYLRPLLPRRLNLNYTKVGKINGASGLSRFFHYLRCMSIQKVFLASLFLVATASGCNSSKKVAAVGASDKRPTLPNDQQLELAKLKWPNTSLADLQEGHRVLAERCSNCHGSPKVKSHNEAEWEKIVAWMAPKAQLSDAETENLRRYVISGKAFLSAK